MVFSQILMDSVSRCFGAPDEISPVTTTTKFADKPLGASREAKQNTSSTDLHSDDNKNDRDNDCQNDHDSHLQIPQFKANARPMCGIGNFMAESSSTPQQQRHHSPHEQCHPNDCIPTDKLNKNDKTYTPPNRDHNPNSCFTPVSRSIDHKASIERSQTKFGKRRLDIFRTPQNYNNSSSSSQPQQRSSSGSSSFASRLLGSPPFPSGAMLCFANPILDEEDYEEEIDLQRTDAMTVDDEETVTSTLYFDAKYAHVVETHPPLALYSTFRVGKDENLVDIFQSGSHKTITSIFCRNKGIGSRSRVDHPPPPPTKKRSMMESMADETMDYYDDDCDEEEDKQNHVGDVQDDGKEKGAEERRTEDEKVRRKSRNSPFECHPNDLDVIAALTRSRDRNETVDMRNMKLMSNSSQSTAALTPVCSSRSHASMSPVMEVQKRQSQSATLH